jgi:hypothetical protein
LESEYNSPFPADFVAELTTVAYDISLRYAVDRAWLDLELDLWDALTQVAKKLESRS